jgi:enoyl-CoA hydratase/carnithine racemase
MLGELAASPAISVIVLTGAPPVFCAGHDLREMTARRQDADRGRAFFRHLMGLCSEVVQAVMNCPKPVIAAVNGTATAAGCQLVASCDLAIASEEAKFATPGVNIGLFCSTPMVALSRNVPRKRAMEMLLLGESTDAATALQMGLVNRVVPADQVFSHAMDMAGTIASKSSGTIKFGKEAFYRQLEMPVAQAYDYAAEIMTENMLTRDAEEGIGAFLQKRPPRWGKAD